jgi:hypothetical protein
VVFDGGANPTDDCRRIRFAGCADSTFLSEMRSDIDVMHDGRHFSHPVDDFGWITDTVRHIGWKLHDEVGAGICLPTNVCNDLLWNRCFLDRNILYEQPQDLLSIFGLCGGGMP